MAKIDNTYLILGSNNQVFKVSENVFFALKYVPKKWQPVFFRDHLIFKNNKYYLKV